MIKLLDLLNEMDYPKGKYIQVTDSSGSKISEGEPIFT